MSKFLISIPLILLLFFLAITFQGMSNDVFAMMGVFSFAFLDPFMEFTGTAFVGLVLLVVTRLYIRLARGRLNPTPVVSWTLIAVGATYLLIYLPASFTSPGGFAAGNWAPGKVIFALITGAIGVVIHLRARQKTSKTQQPQSE